MKTLIISGLLALSSVAAFADNADTWEPAASASGTPLTRAQVLDELRKAQANNEIAFGEHASMQFPKATMKSTLTRRQVLDEVAQLRKVGKLPLSGERNHSTHRTGRM